ncbi:MAG: cell division protein FtsA [Spirochaetales bacterium]|nr:cell division protein FtsA [Spirochaetales bacterium]
MLVDVPVVGLDIGTTKVCTVVGRFNENNIFEILGMGKCKNSGVRNGVVVNIESTVDSILKAIEEAELESGVSIFNVTAGIAGAHIKGMNSRGVVAVTGKNKVISELDVERVLEAAKAVVIPMDREILHVEAQDYIVDGQNNIKQAIGMIGTRFEAEVHIVTGSATAKQNLTHCINRASYKIDDLILNSFASAEAVLHDDERELGVLMLDFGSSTVDAVLFVNKVPYYSNVFSYGGDLVTSDIACLLKTPNDVAEHLKISSGCCYPSLCGEDEDIIVPKLGGRPSISLPRDKFAEIIEARMKEIFLLIKKDLEARDLVKMVGGGIVLTGGVAKSEGIAELANQVFQISSRVGIPHGIIGLKPEYMGPEFSTAIGLTLHAARGLENRANQVKYKKTKPTKNGNLVSGLFAWLKEFIE